MILKMTNKDRDFYTYLGKLFGSRIVQSETKDRFYDDNNKIWYVYLEIKSNKCLAYVSIYNNVIKNVYSYNEPALTELLMEIKKNYNIQPSIVTKIYQDIYEKCGFFVNDLENYKHFIMIRGEK